MKFAVKPKKNYYKWYRTFVVFPHRTIDGYRVFLGGVWTRKNRNLTGNIFEDHGREYAVTIPLEDGMKMPGDNWNVSKLHACIVCDEKQYPLCFDCKKAILAFRAICDKSE